MRAANNTSKAYDSSDIYNTLGPEKYPDYWILIYERTAYLSQKFEPKYTRMVYRHQHGPSQGMHATGKWCLGATTSSILETLHSAVIVHEAHEPEVMVIDRNDLDVPLRRVLLTCENMQIWIWSAAVWTIEHDSFRFARPGGAIK